MHRTSSMHAASDLGSRLEVPLGHLISIVTDNRTDADNQLD